MTDKQLTFLTNFKEDTIAFSGKTSDSEIQKLVYDLISLNVISEKPYNKTLIITDLVSFDKLIELKSLSEFKKWYSDKDKIIVDNSLKIYGDNYGIQSSNSDLIKPIIQTKVKTTPKEPPKKSWIEILYWVIGIIVGMSIIYEFFLKSLF